jgi:hypothetical protein
MGARRGSWRDLVLNESPGGWPMMDDENDAHAEFCRSIQERTLRDSSMTDKYQIKTGTESPERADATAQEVAPDVWGYADDGEFATRWAVERIDDTTVRVEIHRQQAGLDEVDVVEEQRIGADVATADWALARANDAPTAAIQTAIEYFGGRR